VTTQATSRAGYVDAYRKMREGALYLIIAFLLIGSGVIATLLAYFPVHIEPHGSVRALATSGPSVAVGLGPRASEALASIAVLLSLLAVLVIGGIIGLVGLWGKFVPGVRRLAELNPEFETSSTLIYIGLLWGIVLMMIGAVLLIVVVGVFILLAGWILTIIGYVGLLILGLKLNDLEKNPLYLVAGILFIIGIFVPILDFIAWILLYVALGESIRKAEVPPASPTSPTPLSPS
jgi:MFS family permease